MNFVKIKLALSKINSGEELVTVIDDGEAIDKVPKSIEMDGHFLKNMEMFEESWKLTIKKR